MEKFVISFMEEITFCRCICICQYFHRAEDENIKKLLPKNMGNRPNIVQDEFIKVSMDEFIKVS